MMAAAVPAWVVVEPVANMHSRPSAEADVVSQAIYGTSVAGLEEKEGWIRVRTPDDYTGWMTRASLRPQGEREYASAGTAVTVVSLFANLYAVPDVTRHKPLLTVPFEARLEVIAEPEDKARRWIQVRLPEDRSAWVQRGDIGRETKPLSVEETILLSRKFLGLPYFWGGTSSFGFDCSGFTQMLCRWRGMTVPRDADPQMRWEGMAEVRREDLAPGDLLYFGEPGKKITHAGMYIGDGEFIHATTHLKPVVQISRLDDPHWVRLLRGCRRLR